jgi:hypothetical protein
LETRGLHTLARQKAIDSLPMNAQHTADTYGVETAVVDEAPDRLGMHTELICDLANADETGISAFRRHAVASLVQVGQRRIRGLDVAIRRNAADPDALEGRRAPLERPGTQEARDPYPNTGRCDHSAAGVDDEERDAHVTSPDCRHSASSDPALGAPCSERLPEEPQLAVSAASARTASKARTRTL